MENTMDERYASLLKRAWIFLEDGEFVKADEYAERVLDIEPECADAYLIKLCCNLKVTSCEHIANQSIELTENKNYQKAMRYGGEELKHTLQGFLSSAKQCIAAKNEARVNKLRAAKMISAGYDFTIGVKSDGSVLAVGDNYFKQCKVQGWRNIAAVSCGATHTAALKLDGHMIAAGTKVNGLFAPVDIDVNHTYSAVFGGYNCNTVGICKTYRQGEVDICGSETLLDSEASLAIEMGHGGTKWTNIVDVALGKNHYVGLRSDGGLYAYGANGDKQLDIGNWTDIVAISAGENHTVGLKSDGTVVATGRNAVNQCEVSDWQDIIAISAGSFHTVGLKSDGTVVATGNNTQGQCYVSSWRDIVAVAAGGFHTVGVKSDGTVVAVGQNDKGQCDVHGWKLFSSINAINNERRESLLRQRDNLTSALSTVKGIFANKHKKEINEQINEIDIALKNL